MKPYLISAILLLASLAHAIDYAKTMAALRPYPLEWTCGDTEESCQMLVGGKPTREGVPTVKEHEAAWEEYKANQQAVADAAATKAVEVTQAKAIIESADKGSAEERLARLEKLVLTLLEKLK